VVAVFVHNVLSVPLIDDFSELDNVLASFEVPSFESLVDLQQDLMLSLLAY